MLDNNNSIDKEVLHMYQLEEHIGYDKNGKKNFWSTKARHFECFFRSVKKNEYKNGG